MNTESPFQQLLRSAELQTEPQRLLFVFTTAELPENASAEQRRQFAAGQGGSLTPLICVDKAPEELVSFEALRDESAKAGPPWQVVFIAALSGQGGRPPSAELAEQALQTLVERVRVGRLDGLMALDHDGRLLSLA